MSGVVSLVGSRHRAGGLIIVFRGAGDSVTHHRWIFCYQTADKIQNQISKSLTSCRESEQDLKLISPSIANSNEIQLFHAQMPNSSINIWHIIFYCKIILPVRYRRGGRLRLASDVSGVTSTSGVTTPMRGSLVRNYTRTGTCKIFINKAGIPPITFNNQHFLNLIVQVRYIWSCFSLSRNKWIKAYYVHHMVGVQPFFLNDSNNILKLHIWRWFFECFFFKSILYNIIQIVFLWMPTQLLFKFTLYGKFLWPMIHVLSLLPPPLDLNSLYF